MIHHLNCASFAPRLVGPMVAHVLLVERAEGLLLVDSGFGTADIADPVRLGRAFRSVMRPVLRREETALAQVEALGFSADDVTDIVLTHLDLDHVGGVGDFPGATVHVYDTELAAARRPRGMEHGRYLPVQWKDARFATHHVAGDEWLGFESVTVLGDDVLMVPLHGHSRGHTLVAVRDSEGWQVHAGDAYFHRGDLTRPPTTPRVLRVVQKLLAQDDEVRIANQDRLRDLVQADHPGLRIFSAHDPVEYAAFVDAATP
ncbi:MBL fold metallo-hydrolase [Nocardioides rubriscoriae]|uniref:MBL fold metallo-hydrolase n=1 Tax=Nocardioides rubriscoriae TaxID=642762 RepID=UPI001FE645A2|nr:MBL fold metallo-hydrolase [Nocardioides rubriscoriae]